MNGKTSQTVEEKKMNENENDMKNGRKMIDRKSVVRSTFFRNPFQMEWREEWRDRERERRKKY